MIKFLYFVAICIKYVSCVDLWDADLTTPQLITKYGYKSETHFVTTADGYILQIHRIAQSPKTPKLSLYNKNIVLIVHGFASTSADFIIAGPKVALGYYLADLGYDVWMANCRGNRYSRSHTKLSPENSKFWEFTFHEMGVYDLPATIDYILKTTKHKTLSYIGYSLGVTVFFVMCSERPEYQNKINLMQALGPLVYMFKTRNIVIRLAGYLTNTIELKRLKRPPYEIAPNTVFFREFGKVLCSSPFKNICTAVLFEFMGIDRKYTDPRLIPIMTGHIPSGASNLVAAHIGQLCEEDRFGQFDMGDVRKNLARYGRPTPTDYSLANTTVPVMIVNSQNDLVSYPDDVFRLRDILPNVVEYHEPIHKEFNHGDYILARDVRRILYTKIVEVLGKYSRN